MGNYCLVQASFGNWNRANPTDSAVLLATTIASTTYERSSLLGMIECHIPVECYRLRKIARPVQSSIVFLSILGVTFFLFHNRIARFITPSFASNPNTFELPLQEIPLSNGRKDSNESRPGKSSTAQPRSRKTFIVSTALAISLRVLLSGLILDNAQCSIASIAVKTLLILDSMYTNYCQGYLPLLLAIYDYWYIQRRRPKSDTSYRANGSSFRNLWPAIFLTAAYHFKASFMACPRSTYICPLSSIANIGVPFMQILSTLLDCYIIVSVSSIASEAKWDASPKSDNPSVLLGHILLVSS